MKIAIIGSRGLHVNDLERYLPEGITEIVSGGARGIDSDARAYAKAHDIPLKEFLPDYERFGRSAPLKRNLEIIAYAQSHSPLKIAVTYDSLPRTIKALQSIGIDPYKDTFLLVDE